MLKDTANHTRNALTALGMHRQTFRLYATTCEHDVAIVRFGIPKDTAA